MRHILPFIIFLLASGSAMAQLRVEHFVRVKGQEATQIRAYGLVGGLNGTGDDPRNYTAQAVAILEHLKRSGIQGVTEAGVRGARNVALVEVMVTIPGTGGRNGDSLDCTIYSLGSASSLAGGVLSMTALSTPFQQDGNSLTLGMAQGRVVIEDPASPNVGRIVKGCRLLADFSNPYIQEGLITLVINKEHASPIMANKIAEEINKHPEFSAIQPARAVGANYVVLRMPTDNFNDPVDFLSQILNVRMEGVPRPVPRVMINERSGTISVDLDVEVRPTLVTHRNIVADIRPEFADSDQDEFQQQFIDIDTDTRFRQMSGEVVNNVKLRALQASLNAIQATPQDIIEIIKILHAQGAIVGDVMFVD